MSDQPDPRRRLQIPADLDRLRSEQGGVEWLASLPSLVEECAAQWRLLLDPPYLKSFVSLALPGATPDGTEVVLKIQYPHRESAQEAAALEVWNGDGAVRLLEWDPTRRALLLERCIPGHALSAAEESAALDVLIELLPRLCKPVAAPFTSLADEARRWAGGLVGQWDRAGRPCPGSWIEAAVELLGDLAATFVDSVLLHQDLHPENVLAATREPWLVIDPKPLAGDRAFAVAPIVRAPELGHGRDRVLRRLDRLTDELGLDRERARAWTFAQTMAWAFEGDTALPRHLDVAGWLRPT